MCGSPGSASVTLGGIDEAVLKAAPDPEQRRSGSRQLGAAPAQPRLTVTGLRGRSCRRRVAASVGTSEHPATLVAVSADAAFAAGTSIQVRVRETAGWSDWESSGSRGRPRPRPRLGGVSRRARRQRATDDSGCDEGPGAHRHAIRTGTGRERSSPSSARPAPPRTRAWRRPPRRDPGWPARRALRPLRPTRRVSSSDLTTAQQGTVAAAACGSPADHPVPGPVGRRRVVAFSWAALHRRHPGRLPAPHGLDL